MRKPKPLDPKSMYRVVADGAPLTPKFYHEELAKAALRQISKVRESAQLERIKADTADGNFADAVEVVSRETRWLVVSRQDKSTFEALCEGWLSMAESGLPKAATEGAATPPTA